MRKTQAEHQQRWAEKKMRDPEWQEIARRYQEGEAKKYLAFIYGKNPALVSSVLVRLGLRSSKMTPELREMIRLYEGGCTLEEIGRLFECTRQSVSMRIQRRTKMRPSRAKGWPGWPDMIARGEW